MDPNIYALVLDTLHRATSQNTEVLKPAEKKLQEWEIEPGYYSVLLDILSNQSIDVNVRWLAVMCLKNGVDRYWRRTAPNAITEEDKQKLRQGLLTSNILSEPVMQIATQQAVLIAKIARYDCPLYWPSLVPELMSSLKAPQPLVQYRSLLIFHHVVKALASKRLAGDKQTFQELTNTVYGFILNLWHENTELFLRHIQEGAATDVITEHLEKALLCLRILRKLTMFGFKKAHESRDAVAFLNIVFDRAKSSLECRKLLKGRGIYPLELCEKFIIHLTKVALGVLSTQPFSYVPLIRPSLEFAIYYCFTEQGMSLTYERFTIQCLNIVKGVLQCMEYSLPKITDQIKEPLAIQAYQMKSEVLDENTVCHMCRHLVTRYFVLSGDELALWDAEPESFATDEAGESWKYSLRPCTEAVFVELIQSYRAALAPELLRLLRALPNAPAHDLAAILHRDAIYNAVGLAAFDLYDDVNFDEWFTNVLSAELKIQDDNYRIIRRRVCQLVGQWCSVRASQHLRPALYAALLEPLSRPNEDPAVKLAAAEALRHTIDDFNFDVEQFTPFAPHALAALYDLLVESEECDTKMHVLHVVSFVAERCGNAVACGGGAAALFAALPALWAHAHKHNMLRAAALATVVHLLKALGECPSDIRSWVLGVVDEATRLDASAHLYLLEDALELWLALLEAAPAIDPQLLALAVNLPPILENLSTEHLRIVVYIMQAYSLLCPEEFFTGAGARCMEILDDMLADMRKEGIITVLKMAEICISVTFPEKNMYLGVKVIWPILIRVIRWLLDGDDLGMVVSVELSLISRVILLSPDLFYKVVEEAAGALPEYGEPDRVLSRVLHVWTDKMNLVTQVERWKVAGLGLAALLTTQNATVLQRFPAILLNLTEVLNDIMKVEDGGVPVDWLAATPGSRPASPLEGRGGAARWEAGGAEPHTPHEARRRRLAAAHPAHALDLRAVTHHQLETLKNQVGAENFQRMLQSTDKDTLQQIREYIPL